MFLYWMDERNDASLCGGSVILVSLYLVLTWALLLASIDAVNFEAHELYGAPFMTGIALCFFLYTRRKDDPKDNPHAHWTHPWDIHHWLRVLRR